MGLIEELQRLAETIRGYSGLNEAGTETFCFEPFIELLGFGSNPVDMEKQYPADISGGNRTVDYAIKKDGVPIMIVECKPLGVNLDSYIGGSLLGYYFAVVQEVRFGILTDGRFYQFYTDLNNRNRMDPTPFLEFDLFNIQAFLVAELEWFSKSRFDLDEALAAARNLKNARPILDFLSAQANSPAENFVNFIAGAIGIDIDTPEQREQITETIQQLLRAFRGDEPNSLPPLPLPLPEIEPYEEEETDSVPDGTIELNPDKSWTYRKIRGFRFNGELYEVGKWSDFLVRFCEILSEGYPNRFEAVLEIVPRFFSLGPPDTGIREIGDTGIYVKRHISNRDKKRIIEKLVEHFGCDMPVIYVAGN